MKKYNKIYLGILALLLSVGISSCESYLDRDPATAIDPEAAYKNFFNFQGFVDELYGCIPNIMSFDVSHWNLGEEEHYSLRQTGDILPQLDKGNFDAALRQWIYSTNANANSNSRKEKAIWQLGWYGIRKANMGIANLDKMLGTDEEKNLIEGQLYFFRGWFHYTIAQFWGGIPYIDTELSGETAPTNPRETYEQTLLKAIADFETAESLLPDKWDGTEAGQASVLTNELRINKYMAMCYAGKAYLYLGSPWLKWQKGESYDQNDPASPVNYNKEYCQKAADKLGQFLTLVENGTADYELLPWDKYEENWMTEGQNRRMPGGKEAIFRGPIYDGDGASIWHQYLVGRFMYGRSWSLYPTANYSNFFGMANGMPINDYYDQGGQDYANGGGAFNKSDTRSGYDSEKPWDGRDTRFYKNFGFDGLRLLNKKPKDAKYPEDMQWAHLYSHSPDNPSTYRAPGYNNNEGLGSTTGLLLVKFNKHLIGNNKGLLIWNEDKASNGCWHLSWMRLGDVYLMYAEALAIAKNSPNAINGNCSLTALNAVDKIRSRANMPAFLTSYRSDMNAFMRELRRERAVELAFEGHRFYDLRRWLLWDKEPYTIKTSIEFDRGEQLHPESGANVNWNATQYRVLNAREVVLIRRNYEKKHYWLPFKTDQIFLYPGFGQNPGW